MSGLGPGVSPRELIAGDPDELELLAGWLRRYAGRAADTTKRFDHADAAPWPGEEGALFRAAVGLVPTRLAAAAEAFEQAAAQVSAYAQALRAAQGQAAEAVALVEEAGRISASWRDAGSAGTDPGEVGRSRARMLLGQAREAADRAGQRAAAALAEVTARAPRDAVDILTSAAPVVRTADAVITTAIEHELADPGAYIAPVGPAVDDLRFGHDHEVGFDVGDAADWEQWASRGEGRAVGRIGSELVAVAGVAVFGGVLGRRSRPTAFATAGLDADKLRGHRTARRRAHDGVMAPATPRRPADGDTWRTNLAAVPHPSTPFRVWSGAESSPLSSTAPAPAVTLAPAGEQAQGVVRHSGPPDSEEPYTLP